MKNNLVKYLFLILRWFFILEVLSRLIINIPPFYETYIKDVSDAGYRLKWIKTLPQNTSYPIESWNVYSPSLGWALRPNIRNEITPGNKILNTNSKGIRGKIEYRYEKDPHRTRILILGDSFTFGSDVSDTETYPYYLQQMLPSTEVINLGVNGYGQDQMFIYLLQEGLKYHPDIILVGFGLWDRIRNSLEFFSAAKPKFRWIRHQLVLCNSPVPSPQRFLKHEFWRSKFLDLVDIARFDLLSKFGVTNQEAKMITHHILEKMAYTAQKNNAQIILVPLGQLFTDNLVEDNPVLKKVVDAWKNKGVPCIFPKPFPLSEKDAGIFPSGHYAPFVNERIAEGIKEYLLNKKLIKRAAS